MQIFDCEALAEDANRRILLSFCDKQQTIQTHEVGHVVDIDSNALPSDEVISNCFRFEHSVAHVVYSD